MKAIFINGERNGEGWTWDDAARAAGYADREALHRWARKSNGAISMVEAPNGFFIKLPQKG